MISTKDLQFSYNGKHTFIFPDLHCQPGETLLITGNSGTGKTTLLHLLGGLLVPKNGIVNINGVDFSKLSQKDRDVFRGKNIGMILQKSYFIESLNVIDNIVLASWLVQKKKAVERAEELLKKLDIGQHKYKMPSELSVGQQQRVNIARALINEPKILLADEPTSSLDDENATVVSGLLQQLASEQNAALLIVTHDQRLKNIFPNHIQL